MPLTADEIDGLLEQAEQRARTLPVPPTDDTTTRLRRLAAPTSTEWLIDLQASIGDRDATPDDYQAMRAELFAGLSDDAQRSRLFAATAPELAADLERLWQRGRSFPNASYVHGGIWSVEPPFRQAPAGHDADERLLALIQPLLQLGRSHRLDLATSLRWADRHASAAAAISTAVAFAIDDGDRELAALVDALIDGTDDDGNWSAALPIALLRQRDPAAWARAHEMLLGAGRQEGLRELILRCAGESSPAAFAATLQLIVDHELHRFASVVGVIGRWYGIDLDATNREANGELVASLAALVADEAARADVLATATDRTLRRALWASAVHSLPASINACDPLLTDPDPARRAAAVAHLLPQHAEPGVADRFRPLLEDPELRIAVAALQGLGRGRSDQPPTLGEAGVRLLDRLPPKATELPGVGVLGPIECSRNSAVYALVLEPGVPALSALVAVLPELDASARQTIAQTLGDRLAAEHRGALLALLGDASEWVRHCAFEAAAKLTLTDDEARALEPLLRRKAGDLRQNVLTLIAARGPAWSNAAADRLLAERAAPLRLAGVDLLARLGAGDDATARAAAVAKLQELATTSTGGPLAQAVEAALAACGAVSEPVEDDGFGMFDPADLTPPLVPEDRGTTFMDDDVERVLLALDGFIAERSDDEITLDAASAQARTTTVGEIGSYGLMWELPEELLAATTSAVNATLPPDPEAAALALTRAWFLLFSGGDYASRVDGLGVLTRRAQRASGQTEAQRRALAGRAPLQLEWAEAALHLITRLLPAPLPPTSIDWLLDASESLLLLVPERDPRDGPWGVMPDRAARFGRVQDRLLADPDAWSDAQLGRYWGLRRWLMDVADPVTEEDLTGYGVTRVLRSARIPRRPERTEVLALHARAALTEADFLDHLVGPRNFRPYWHDLAALVAGDPEEKQHRPSDRAIELARRARDRVVEVELGRGEAPTQASAVIAYLGNTGGLDVFLRAIRALGRDSLVRGSTYNDWTRSAIFSQMLQAAWPADGELPEHFAARVEETGASRQRLLEIASYAPQWAGHIEAALGIPGLEDAVWWVHAHTKEERWNVSDSWKRAMAERTELSEADLADGAVDVAWFQRVREQISAKGLAEVLSGARFASSGAGHKRAELFALALESKVPLKDLRARITGKRHQDSVRALGLRPLSPRRADADLRERYDLIQQFRRESRQFGSQRQESEARAVEIALANLARTAGYRDPIRLAWAMEAQAVADLVGGVEVVRDDLVVRLALDAGGRPELTIRRGERPLKTIPPKLRKDPEIAALAARQTDLRRSRSRVRDGLEQAMVRGDAFTGAELARLGEHLILWPQLRELVLIDEAAGLLGRPSDAADALVDASGASHPVDLAAELRLAHPVDLLASGDWQLWQRRLFEEQRRQPFKQVFRELYVPVADEEEERYPGVSRRYAGHQVRPKQALALLTGKGWLCEQWAPPTRTLRAEGIVAQVDQIAAWGTPLEFESPTIEHVTFHRIGSHKPLPLAEVPPRAFSEIMRDLDLVVSVAHAGDVDPEASMSTVEARAALVLETAALLGLSGVRIDGRRALVDGRVGKYAVHLGSGVVTKMPGGAICIVPVGAQHRGPLYLPFADDDPRSAEILSKVLLVAHDDEVRDPSIRSQLGV